MLGRLRILIIGVAAAAMTVTLLAGPAAAGTGRPFYTAEQAGYAATGARFNTAEIHTTLPNAARFAREIGRLSISVQLWTSYDVLDLSVSTCTDSTCRPGGRPVRSSYRQEFQVFSRTTHALICSTVTGPLCPNGAWRGARLRAGRRVTLTLAYERAQQVVFAGVTGQYTWPTSTKTQFRQARIAVEFGTTPWRTAPVRAPSHRMLVASLGIPTPPPYMGEIATYSGHISCLTSWWAHHKVRMTRSGTARTKVLARPSGLTAQGCDFGVYLAP